VCQRSVARGHSFSPGADHRLDAVKQHIHSERVAEPYFDYLFATADELRSLLANTEWVLAEYEVDEPTYAAVFKKR
jgi:hypothetical protein